MANTNLNISVKSNLKEAQQVLIYQEALTLNVKNFKTAAWEYQHIAPGSNMQVLLPMEVCIGAFKGIGHNGRISTKLIQAEYNTAWEIFSNNKAIDVRKSSEPDPEENTIEIHNKNSVTSDAIVTKDGKPLFLCSVRPDFKVSFALKPKVFIALCDLEITDPFFDAATLSRAPVGIDYEGQQYLTVTLNENESSGAVSISYDFNKF
ncbi:MAG: hypothetical protein FWG90_06515 [Oscillospiraceae bacterium]|nr:hypothetical protein [Oscillospiraceae bacterium]